jgi:hypothetical protein
MTRTNFFAAAILYLTFVGSMHAQQQSPAERVAEIQSALRDAKLDGWLFYDFRHSDPRARRDVLRDLVDGIWLVCLPHVFTNGMTC